jgi:probable HAF family extracellular repeat protein
LREGRGWSRVSGRQDWDGRRMRHLGTRGGDTGSANWVNGLGEVVGLADLPGSGTQLHHGFLWKAGKMTDLGVVPPDPCSRAESINLQGQIVGNSGGTDGDCGAAFHAFLWESGAIYDLNLLIPPGSGLTLIEAVDINDLGEIMGLGLLSNGEERAYLLVPCDQHDPGNCQNQLLETTNTPVHPAIAPDKVDQLRNRLARSNRGRS